MATAVLPGAPWLARANSTIARGAGQFDAWVTPQVNMSALTGQVMAMGEDLLVNAQGKMTDRIPFV